MDVALDALTTIEEHCGHLSGPRRRTMTVHGWEATAAVGHAHDVLTARLPQDERHLGGPQAHGAVQAPVREVTTKSAATLVRLAKFSTREQVRGRAFYLDQEPALTIKFVLGSASDTARLEREIVVRTALARTHHLPAPVIVNADVASGMSYLAETVVFGQHAHEPKLKQALALELVTALLMTHREVGVTDEPVEVHRQTIDRLERLINSSSWLPQDRAERVLDHSKRLIDDDAPMPVGWCHGDLGFSNVIVDDAGVPTLIDWEHAARMPVAVDLAKLATMSPKQHEVVDHIVASARPDDIGERPGRRTVADQLALMVVRELSWWERRLASAVSAGRLAPYERGIKRRFALLDLLLAARTVS